MLTLKEHQEFDNWKECPICHKKYDLHWKILNHIRKSLEKDHIKYFEKQCKEAIEIYDTSERQKFHKILNSISNIFCGISFKSFCGILKQKYSVELMEEIRKKRIQKTMKTVLKTDEQNIKISKSVKKAWEKGVFYTIENSIARKNGYKNRKSFAGSNNPMYNKPSPHGSGRGKSGFRKDLNMYFRSTWEANFARVLKMNNIDFSYESNVFYFNIEDRKFSYRPDFFIVHKNVFYEIKGHAKSRKKWDCNCKNCVKTRHGIKQVVLSGFKIKIIGLREYKRIISKFKNRNSLFIFEK